MASNTARLARVFTPEYARRINTQIVFPASSVVVKPNDLESSLSRPLNVSIYEPNMHIFSGTVFKKIVAYWADGGD